MKDDIERQRDRTGRLFRIDSAVCQGVPEGTSGTGAKRQRDKTRRFFRSKHAVCCLTEPAAPIGKIDR
jgi:hypothetical protein